MVLGDFLSYRNDDALPADHGTEAESEGDGDFHPKRNEAGGAIALFKDLALVVLQDGNIGGELRLTAFLHDECHVAVFSRSDDFLTREQRAAHRGTQACPVGVFFSFK
jgi:hypothetical protein